MRNGFAYVDHSFSFRSRSTLLLPEDEWRVKYNHYYGHLNLLQDPKVFLALIVEHLDQGQVRLSKACQRGEVRIDDDVAQLAVDTHRYTDFAIATALSLGFDLWPALSHIRNRHLHVPVDHLVPEDVLPWSVAT